MNTPEEKIAARDEEIKNLIKDRERLRDDVRRLEEQIDSMKDQWRLSSVCRMQRVALEAVWDCWTKGADLRVAEALVRALVKPNSEGNPLKQEP